MKTSIFYKFLLAIAVSLLSVVYTASAQSDDFIRATHLLQTGDLATARTLLEKEIAANPDNDAAYYFLSNAVSFENEQSTVEYCLKKAVALTPDNFWYKYNLAIFYANTDRVELTIKLLEDLISEYPKKSSLYFDLANLYVSQHEIDKAIAALDKIEGKRGKSEAIALTKFELMSKSPTSNADSVYTFISHYYQDCKTPRLATMLGDYYARSYNDSLALKFYNEATAIDEDYSPAYFGKANIYQSKRQYGRYFENLGRFMEDENINPAVKADYMNELTSSAQFTHTFKPELDSIIGIIQDTHPGDSVISVMSSGYYYRTGRPYLAADILKQTSDLYPESASIAMQYLIFLYYQKAWPALIEQSTLMLQRFKGNSDILQIRAIAFTQQDNLRAAIEDYQAILDQKPADTLITVSTYSAIGDLYYKVGETAKAYLCYDKALKINPDYCPALNNYAYFLSLEGKKLKKAKEMSKRTIEAEPDNPTYLDTYAWILHLMGDNLEAKAMFKHAMQYGGKDSAEMLRHYAEVLQALGENDLANIYRTQAKNLEQR